MSEDFSSKRCSVYPDRVAVARCPECHRFFSRECITEHEGRLICASCLSALTDTGKRERRRITLPVTPFIQGVVALLAVWLIYYAMARLLILIPSNFHEGTIWSE